MNSYLYKWWRQCWSKINIFTRKKWKCNSTDCYKFPWLLLVNLAF